ncbi:MAG: HAMP domain-containing histidine kinase, partial [Proteobacteria bacterium]
MKTPTIAVVAAVAMALITLLDEQSKIQASDQLGFLALKGFAILLWIFAAIELQRSKSEISFSANLLFAAGGILYSIFSSLYRPWYLISVFEISLVFAFLIPHTKRFFWIFSVIYYGGYNAFFLARWPNVIENQISLGFSDWMNIGFQYTLISGLVYFFFVRAKRFRVRSEMRLESIGRNASKVMADLNVMSALPREDLLLVEKLVGGPGAHSVSEILSLTQTQLRIVQTAMLELSSLTSVAVKDVCEFSVAERIKSLAATLAPAGKSLLTFDVTGDLVIHADRTLVTSLLFNLCANSLRAFEERKTQAPIITWTLTHSPPSIAFEDNAGGFDAEALRHLKKSIPYTGFRGGSGLGYQIMRDCV